MLADGLIESCKILLVEDDIEIAEAIVFDLSRRGYGITHIADGRLGLAEALDGHYAMMVIDRMLPGLDGLQLIRELRQRNNYLPALFLSAMAEVDDRVDGLSAGADDYLTKPFVLAELGARVAALLRRAALSRETTLSFGPLELDLVKRTLSNNGDLVTLLPKEFDLLEYLMRNPGGVVSRTMLLQNVWGYRFAIETNVVDVTVGKLRRKIEPPDGPRLIHNVRGIGFTLANAPVTH